MTDLWRGLIEAADPDDLAELADRLRPFLPPPAASNVGEWMDSKAAVAHLGVSMATLRRLTAAQTIPVHQDRAGGRVFFRRAELDEWRSRQGSKSGHLKAVYRKCIHGDHIT